MTRRAAVLAIVIVGLGMGNAWAHDGHSHKIMGTVTARQDNRVEVKTPGGEIPSIAINEKTSVLRGKQKASSGEVKTGRRVVVDIGNGEDPLIAREIQLGPAKVSDE